MAIIEPTHAVLALCRAGFEGECGQELADLAGRTGGVGYVRARNGTAMAEFVASEDGKASAPAVESTIFARQVVSVFARLTALDVGDRISPMLAAVRARADEAGRVPWREVLIESPDSDGGRELAPLCRRLAGPLDQALLRAGLLSRTGTRRLHVVFTATDAAMLGEHTSDASRPAAGGIPRLRRLSGAPSRSAAKLDEALAVMMDADERQRLLQPGMRAVDLGAAPGGWTWVLTRHHVQVSAIDNGPLAAHVMDTGLVTHVRADGFRWRPAKTVDWLVCDMVEQPIRVATLIGGWLADGACRQALFNLKLPMKKRYAETLACLERLRDTAGLPLDLRCRQLYHDREEVTVLAIPARR
ncbi:23S rRNA (cytidine2498-2'-O)-methyltransferase [Pseudofulvimonas gallinarii]|uniref:23S rRNA (Cytidine2498-2'-O)-methyltransferase n=1 Tax=Pseudofulvimonas gallinarii TaxID=634155 RepID=A0A4R3LKR1_9GAMM|nr:23S rRNA (cytidine2498-2'-O)-methyltransferase [Pseudofulvimonas gallinarii]